MGPHAHMNKTPIITEIAVDWGSGAGSGAPSGNLSQKKCRWRVVCGWWVR